jgi:hypothetical protein
MAVLRLMQLAAQKGDTLVDVLTVELGLLVVLFGRRFKAGWHSHAQRIVIGLSTVAISWLSVEGVWQIIAATAHPHSREEYVDCVPVVRRTRHGSATGRARPTCASRGRSGRGETHGDGRLLDRQPRSLTTGPYFASRL